MSPRGLDLASRIAGGVILGLVLGMLAAASCACGPQPPPVCPSRVDDAETPVEIARGDACHRAGLQLAKVCPKLWRKDWDDFCHEMGRQGVPLCPAKLAKATSCAEAEAVCR